MSAREAVCSVEDLGPGDRIRYETATGQEVAVFNFEGEIYAISNTCAHFGGPICKGKVQGTLVGEFQEPGERIKESFSDKPAVACPLHGWEYDLETGVHLGDDSISIPTYETVVEDGTVFVRV